MLNPASAKNESTVKRVLRALGPGVTTGATGDDPSGVTTFGRRRAIRHLVSLDGLGHLAVYGRCADDVRRRRHGDRYGPGWCVSSEVSALDGGCHRRC